MDSYFNAMKRKLDDLGFRIAMIRRRLSGNVDDRTRVDLSGQLAELEGRHDQLQARLEDLRHLPEGGWNTVRAEFEEEWDALVQDFEERLGRLA